MKNQPLNYEAVCVHIRELQASGEKVTVRNLIAKTGGKTAVITAYLRQWYNGPLNSDQYHRNNLS